LTKCVTFSVNPVGCQEWHPACENIIPISSVIIITITVITIIIYSLKNFNNIQKLPGVRNSYQGDYQQTQLNLENQSLTLMTPGMKRQKKLKEIICIFETNV